VFWPQPRREMAADGSPIRGGRVIEETEAAIVRQIFVNFAAGKSPRKIAFDLNDRAILVPDIPPGARRPFMATERAAPASSTTSSISAVWSGTACAT
jgi:hypothetical protein